MITKGKGLAIIRIALGSGFLFAGLDKLMDFAGTGKPFTAAGFLQFATGGAWLGSDPKAIVNPTHDFWVSLGTNPGLINVINVLVVAGEIGIGIALILGLFTRFAGVAGFVMMTLFYIANWSFATGPFNEQFMYGITALYLAYAAAGETWGLDGLIERGTPIIQRAPALRFVLG
ncbi:MAG TPA: DoxX family protein [Candidatus Limnocylindrales bacterium]|nr:DoxX family protein [Candidatus Limnocylindrales bacterium]